jgi:SAM-dependent methyltransferase
MKNKLSYLAYPPTSLPIRDLFLLDNVELADDSSVLEVGVGCGETTARLAGMCRHVVGVDVSDAAVESLKYLERGDSGPKFICLDATDETAELGEKFDVIVSMDTLEHVDDAAAYFRFVWRHLSDDGIAHILFPNELPDNMHGVTQFASEADLRQAAESELGVVGVGSAALNRWPRIVVFLSFGWLIRLRSALKRSVSSPQHFEDTRFYRRIGIWRRLSPLINLYWFVVLSLCRLSPRAYTLRSVGVGDFERDSALYIRLQRHGSR